MKSTNRRKSILLIALVLSILTTTLAISIKSPSSETTSPLGLGIAYCPIAGQEASLTQAQAEVSYVINLPTSLGQYTTLKVDKETNATIIIYAANKPADDANFYDIMQTDAIVLFELPNTLTLEQSKQNILDSIDTTKNDVGSLQPVTINGFFGCVGGNIWHTVTWYTDVNYYQLASSMKVPIDQLIDIANSIPVK
jgi:hypothetical protein